MGPFMPPLMNLTLHQKAFELKKNIWRHHHQVIPTDINSING
jgi:hypothetical protein